MFAISLVYGRLFSVVEAGLEGTDLADVLSWRLCAASDAEALTGCGPRTVTAASVQAGPDCAAEAAAVAEVAAAARGEYYESTKARRRAGLLLEAWEKIPRFLCVGEVQEPEVLMLDASTPVDLLRAYHDPESAFHHWAQEAVRQIYTHMQLWGVCYGFISCYHATWLLYCPGRQRTCLYISAPILSSTCSPGEDGTEQPTALAALAWLASRAIDMWLEGTQPEPCPLDYDECWAAGTGGAGGGGSAGEGQGHGSSHEPGKEATDDMEGMEGPGCNPSRVKPTAAGVLPNSEPLHSTTATTPAEPASSAPASSAAAAAGTPVSPQAAALRPVEVAGRVQLRFERCILDDDDGATIFEGTCGPEPAIIKVYSGSREGLAAYYHEASAYCALSSLQGDVVPYVLAYGQLGYGMRYIAMRPVQGRSLNGVEVPEAVYRAAIRAVKAVQRCCPGCVHGQLWRENVFLLEDGATAAGGGADPPKDNAHSAPLGGGEASGSSSTAVSGGQSGSGGDGGGSGGVEARCMLLDFARSRLDGSPKQQQRERAELRRQLAPAGVRRGAKREGRD